MKTGYYRTIRKNCIKLCGKPLGNKDLKNGELNGQRFFFRPYHRAFEEDGLTALWGTERYARAVNKAVKDRLGEEEMNNFLKPFDDEDRKILAPGGFAYWYFWEEVRDESSD